MKIALGLEYDGSEFCGFQRQKGQISVQQHLESKLSEVANHPITVVCAGRTDTGVHARYQVVHFETHSHRSERAWVYGVNTQSSHAIRVLWAKQVEDSFHARYKAKERAYRYFLYSHPIRPAIMRQYVSWTYLKLDLTRMQKAVDYWIGEHDFSSFRASECQSVSPVRELRNIHIEQQANLFIFDFVGTAFLHHMIRNMVGVLIKIGSNQAKIIEAKTILEARDRRQAFVTAPPNGLYLTSVRYPAEFGLPNPGSNDFSIIEKIFYELAE